MKQQLQAAMKEGMKARDKAAVDTIRLLLAAIQYEELEKKNENLSTEVILSILQREIKKRREELEFADKGGRPELKDALNSEIKVIERFMPQQLSAADVERALVELKSNTPGLNMGSAMKLLKEKFAGQYDAKAASEIAKRLFV